MRDEKDQDAKRKSLRKIIKLHIEELFSEIQDKKLIEEEMALIRNNLMQISIPFSQKTNNSFYQERHRLN